MRSCISILAAAIVTGSPAFADMIVASPGVTLTEAAQAKFNRDTRGDDQVVKPVPGHSGIPAPLYSSAGLTPEAAQGWTLQRVAAVKFNRESSNSQGALLTRTSEPSASPVQGQDRNYSRLAMSVGLSQEQAAQMSFDEITNAKLNSEH